MRGSEQDEESLASDGRRAPALRIRDARVRYGHVLAVDGVSLELSEGEHVVITGSNGSGKSSLIRAVLGLVPLVDGSVEVAGVMARTRGDWRRRRVEVVYVPQRTSPGGFPLLVRELLESGGALDAAVDAARRLSVGELLDRPVTTLSGGQLQRVYLARAVGALAASGRMLVADEPTSALDFDGQEQVGRLLADLPVSRLVVSHDQAVVQRADRVLEMAGGRLRERAV